MAGNNRRSSGSQRSSSGRGISSRGNTRAGNARTSSTRQSAGGNRTGSTRPGANIAGMISVVLVIIIVVVAVAAVLFYMNVKYLYDNTTIIPGVEVEGVDLGGMDRNEAYAALTQKLDEKINELSITIRYDDQYWTYDAASLNASGDISGIIDQAMLYGHTGNLKQMMDEAKYVLNNPEQFTISFGYDVNSVRQIVETLKADIDIPAVEPVLIFDENVGKITNVEDTVALLYNPLRYDQTISLNGLPAEVYFDADGVPVINAEIFTITPGSDGYVVDVETTVNSIIADLSDDSKADVYITTNNVSPTMTEDELRECTTLVYHAKSGISSTSTYERDTNVATALAAFDGMVIMPGETVSFNDTTGERSAENGYMMAPGIGQDKSHVMVWGGGVCQSATIIFNAAIMAGCQVIDKDSHSWPLYNAVDDFGEDARDAMVNWGTSDLKFKNITDYPIYFDTYVHWYSTQNATYAYCNVYTKILPDGQSIDYEPRLMETEAAPEPTYVALGDDPEPFDAKWSWDEELQLLVFKQTLPRPKKYYDVYQRILDVNGNVISEQMWYKSHYEIVKGTYITKPDPDREAQSDNGVG